MAIRKCPSALFLKVEEKTVLLRCENALKFSSTPQQFWQLSYKLCPAYTFLSLKLSSASAIHVHSIELSLLQV